MINYFLEVLYMGISLSALVCLCMLTRMMLVCKALIQSRLNSDRKKLVPACGIVGRF